MSSHMRRMRLIIYRYSLGRVNIHGRYSVRDDYSVILVFFSITFVVIWIWDGFACSTPLQN